MDLARVSDLERVAVSAADVGLEIVVGGRQGGTFRLTDSGRPADGGVVWVPGSELEPAIDRPLTPGADNSFGGPISWQSVTDDAWGGGTILDWHNLGRFGSQLRDTSPLIDTATGTIRRADGITNGGAVTVRARRVRSDLRWERIIEPVTTALGTTSEYVDPAWWAGVPIPASYTKVPGAPAVPGVQDDGAIWWTDPVYNSSGHVAWAIQTARAWAQARGKRVPVVLGALYGYSVRLGLYEDTPLVGRTVTQTPAAGLRVLKGATWHGVAVLYNKVTDPAYHEPLTRMDRFCDGPGFGIFAEERQVSLLARDVYLDQNYAESAYVWSGEYRAVNDSPPPWQTVAHDLYRNGTAPGNGIVDNSLRINKGDDSGPLIVDLERVHLAGNLNNGLNANTAAVVTGEDLVIEDAANNHYFYGLSARPQGRPPLTGVTMRGPVLEHGIVAYTHEGRDFLIEWPAEKAATSYPQRAPIAHRYVDEAWRQVRDWVPGTRLNQIMRSGRHFLQHGLIVDYSQAGPNPPATHWIGAVAGGTTIITDYQAIGYPETATSLHGTGGITWEGRDDERSLFALLDPIVPRVGDLLLPRASDNWLRGGSSVGDRDAILFQPASFAGRNLVLIDGHTMTAYDPTDQPAFIAISDSGAHKASGLDVYVRDSSVECSRLIKSSGIVVQEMIDSSSFYFDGCTLGGTPESAWSGRCFYRNVTFADGETAAQKGLQPIPQGVLDDWPEAPMDVIIDCPVTSVQIGQTGPVWATPVAGAFPLAVEVRLNGVILATEAPNAITAYNYEVQAAPGTNTLEVTTTDTLGVVRMDSKTFEAA